MALKRLAHAIGERRGVGSCRMAWSVSIVCWQANGRAPVTSRTGWRERERIRASINRFASGLLGRQITRRPEHDVSQRGARSWPAPCGFNFAMPSGDLRHVAVKKCSRLGRGAPVRPQRATGWRSAPHLSTCSGAIGPREIRSRGFAIRSSATRKGRSSNIRHRTPSRHSGVERRSDARLL